MDSFIRILRDVEQYPLACYLVEFLSHLDHIDMNELISGSFPHNAYANDLSCQEFFSDFSVFAQNIIKFKSFNINDTLVVSGSSVIQINSDNFLILCEINEFATPFQIDFEIVESVESTKNKLSIKLSSPPKHAMVTNVKFSDNIQINIDFYSNDDFKLVLEAINSGKINTSTPARKISVVQNFISLNNQYDEFVDDVEDEGSPQVLVEESQDSEITESQSLFHSPVNTTKDTSYSDKKSKRAVSYIVAESTRLQQKEENMESVYPEESQQLIIESSEYENLESFQKPIVEQPEKTKTIPSKRKTTLDDIWDFISDDNEDRTEISIKKPAVKKPKAMKCIPAQPKKKSEKANQDVDVEKHLNIKPTTSNQNKKSSEKKKTPKAQLSSIDNNDSFSGLTSPIIHAQARATTRAMSAHNKIAESTSRVTKPSKRPNENIVEVPVKRQKKVVKKTKPEETNKTTRKTRGLKNTEKQAKKAEPQKTVSLTQVFGFIDNESSPKTIHRDPDYRLEAQTTSNKKTKPTNRTKPQLEKKDDESAVIVPKLNIVPASPEVNQYSTTSLNDLDQRPLIVCSQAPNTKSNISLLSADNLLSEAYTTTLQKQIFDSITTFSNQLVNKIQIINDAINKKVMADLTNKYETLFNDLRDSFQSDVNEISGFIGDVKGLLSLPEDELVKYINEKKFGMRKEN